MPFLPADAGLPQDTRKEIRADFLAVRIGYYEPDVSTGHEFMPPSCEGTLESEPAETSNQLTPADGADSRHAGRGNSMAISPMGGIGAPR